jgi:hypothetical protein
MAIHRKTVLRTHSLYHRAPLKILAGLLRLFTHIIRAHGAVPRPEFPQDVMVSAAKRSSAKKSRLPHRAIRCNSLMPPFVIAASSRNPLDRGICASVARGISAAIPCAGTCGQSTHPAHPPAAYSFTAHTAKQREKRTRRKRSHSAAVPQASQFVATARREAAVSRPAVTAFPLRPVLRYEASTRPPRLST